MPKDNERYCYHFLHNQSQGKTQIYGSCAHTTLIETPDNEVYTLPIDARDQRVLVCFDGRVPTGSLAHGAEIVHACPGILTVCSDNAYKRKNERYEEPVTHIVSVRNPKKVEVLIYRFFVLLRSGRYAFRVYRPDTLQPRYLIVDVKDGHAIFSTTS